MLAIASLQLIDTTMREIQVKENTPVCFQPAMVNNDFFLLRVDLWRGRSSS
jgi:hypothetical protein